MSESLPVGGPIQGPQAARNVRDPAESAGTPAAQGAAFQVLLEQLERRADELALKSRAELGPAELAGAVDEARESMHDVFDLQQRLLEAWRQSHHDRGGHGAA